MVETKSLFSFSDHLEALSKDGDPLEILQQTVALGYFRSWLVEGLGYGNGATALIWRFFNSGNILRSCACASGLKR
ncbi:hypothetical protein OVA07_00230 [Novosphingobium sp. SL115]|uniref:hypothetical protein n=1 Tax=Novosphingobium sp. SL115 TaxID=2995150 RepID=UPI002275B98C|nr:hypothetical protein [Novosphingobium sp. SL115]MCY1669451.1 hypothetical protein [Novosphingobium sp. SL115]